MRWFQSFLLHIFLNSLSDHLLCTNKVHKLQSMLSMSVGAEGNIRLTLDCNERSFLWLLIVFRILVQVFNCSIYIVHARAYSNIISITATTFIFKRWDFKGRLIRVLSLLSTTWLKPYCLETIFEPLGISLSKVCWLYDWIRWIRMTIFLLSGYRWKDWGGMAAFRSYTILLSFLKTDLAVLYIDTGQEVVLLPRFWMKQLASSAMCFTSLLF